MRSGTQVRVLYYELIKINTKTSRALCLERELCVPQPVRTIVWLALGMVCALETVQISLCADVPVPLVGPLCTPPHKAREI